MKFGLIDPRKQTFEVVDCATMEDAMKRVGLVKGATDIGTIFRGLSIVVGETSLFEPPDRQAYFAVERRLYGGGAVLYAWNDEGVTIDYEYVGKWFGTWFDSAADVEIAIRRCEIERPMMSVNNQVLWRWPGKNEGVIQQMVDRMPKTGGTVVIDDTVIKIEPK